MVRVESREGRRGALRHLASLLQQAALVLGQLAGEPESQSSSGRHGAPPSPENERSTHEAATSTSSSTTPTAPTPSSSSTAPRAPTSSGSWKRMASRLLVAETARMQMHARWSRLISKAQERHRWAMRGLALKWSRRMPKRIDTRAPTGLTIQGQRWGWREIAPFW